MIQKTHTTIITELNVYKLYQTRHYISSFNLGLSLLCPNDFPVRKSTLIPSDKIIPYTEALHIEWDRPSREVLDTMLRIAAKTTQVVWGVVLAEGMRKMVSTVCSKPLTEFVWLTHTAQWTQGSQGVMAQVAAECFIHASRFPGKSFIFHFCSTLHLCLTLFLDTFFFHRRSPSHFSCHHRPLISPHVPTRLP